MVTLEAKNLSLNEVHQLLNLQPNSQRARFKDILNLPDLTEWEMAEMEQIRVDFQAYGEAPSYQLLPDLNLFDSDRAVLLLQVLKGILL